jgi:UDPglucose 6-dehydrogenase
MKEGEAIRDFQKPDRIVIGTDDDRAFDILSRLYASFNRQRDRIHRMAPKSAEIVKYAANALLATKISFMNEIAALCDTAGADVEHVRLALGADERIGYQFLYPGLGFGGSCFPKDLRALVRTGEELGSPLKVAAAAIEANTRPIQVMLKHMENDLGGLKDKQIAIWGLAFKPKTDDVREAAALRLIDELLKRGAKVTATDPPAIETAKQRLDDMKIGGRVELVVDAYEACRGADALVLVTEWNQYRVPDVAKLKSVMRGRHVFDGRNAMVPEEMIEAGFKYRGLGRS